MMDDLLKLLNQHPIIPLLFSLVSLVITIKQCFVKRRFLTFRLIISTLLVSLSLVVLLFFDYIERMEARKLIAKIIMMALDILAAIHIVSSVEFTVVDAQVQQELNKSLNTLKYYVILDKKDRIKEISELLTEDLNVDFSEIYGMNFFDALEISKYVIVEYNQSECDKETLKDVYEDYDKKAEEGITSSFDILLRDDEGKNVALYFHERPMFNKGKYKGRILIGERKSEDDLIGMEKDLAITTTELNLIKNRFSTILECSAEGIYFNDLTSGHIWCNDYLVKKLNLNGNSLNIIDFYRLIHPDDISFYKEYFKNLNSANYDVSYRMNTGNGYVYIKECGQKIQYDDVIELCGIISVLDNSKFSKTETSLDNILGEPELLARLNTLETAESVYEIVYFKVDSIPHINEVYGRPIGNTILSQYVEFFKNSFVNDNQIYRISGLEFAAIITDFRKMYVLKNNLINGEKLLNINTTYANKKIETKIYMGIGRSDDSATKKNAYKYAKEAMRVSCNPQYNKNFAYYKDLRK